MFAPIAPVSRLRQTVLAALLLTAAFNSAKQVDVHDPVTAREGDTWYLFSTGPGITIYSSKDRMRWKLSDRDLATKPTWAKSMASGFNGYLWAPDIIQRNKQFYFYYSVSAFGKNTSAIGLGHNGAYSWYGKDYLVLHAYETADKYLQKLKILHINWDKDGWPLVDEKELYSYKSKRLK